MARSDGGCDSCGATLPAYARFCMSCGAPTGSVSIEVRKTVTALFCDVVGSTELAGSRDLEMLNAAAAEVTSLLGDSVGSGARWRTALQLCAAKEATAAEAWCRSRAARRHLVARA